jgi:hypothetical protein
MFQVPCSIGFDGASEQDASATGRAAAGVSHPLTIPVFSAAGNGSGHDVGTQHTVQRIGVEDSTADPRGEEISHCARDPSCALGVSIDEQKESREVRPRRRKTRRPLGPRQLRSRMQTYAHAPRDPARTSVESGGLVGGWFYADPRRLALADWVAVLQAQRRGDVCEASSAGRNWTWLCG